MKNLNDVLIKEIDSVTFTTPSKRHYRYNVELNGEIREEWPLETIVVAKFNPELPVKVLINMFKTKIQDVITIGWTVRK